MVDISLDLPDYLRTSNPVIHPNSKRYSRKSLKCLKTPLTQGVSDNAPDFFKISQVPVISSSSRKELYSLQGDRFACDLKKYQITSSKAFNYSDLKSSKFDYDSISCTKGVDLKADRRPLLRKKGEFRKLYDKFIERGFGIQRGEFTVEQSNPKIVRDHSERTDALETILRKTSRKFLHSREARTPCERRLPQEEVTFMLKTKTRKPSLKYLEDLDKFEKALPKGNYLFETRQMYSIKK